VNGKQFEKEVFENYGVMMIMRFPLSEFYSNTHAKCGPVIVAFSRRGPGLSKYVK